MFDVCLLSFIFFWCNWVLLQNFCVVFLPFPSVNLQQLILKHLKNKMKIINIKQTQFNFIIQIVLKLKNYAWLSDYVSILE